jgi:hypothetical protein
METDENVYENHRNNQNLTTEKGQFPDTYETQKYINHQV